MFLPLKFPVTFNLLNDLALCQMKSAIQPENDPSKELTGSIHLMFLTYS